MKNTFEFDSSICERTHFIYKKMDEKDLKLLKYYQIRDFAGKDFDEEYILKSADWVVHENYEMIFKTLGGGSCEIPDMYMFIYKGEKIRVESGGGGNRARIHTRNEDGSYDTKILISLLSIPSDLSMETYEIQSNIAEAFAVYSYKDKRLRKLSVVFYETFTDFLLESLMKH
jgi:hypothetical protein